MTRSAMHINVPGHVDNEAAYIRGAQRSIAANARKGAAKRWNAEHDDAEIIYNWLNGVGEFDGCTNPDGSYQSNPLRDGIFSGDFGEFLLKLRDQLDERGGLSTKQTDIVRKALARKQEWVAQDDQRRLNQAKIDAKSVWVGDIKERRDWELTITFTTGFEGTYGYVWINVMKDDDGNVIVGKGTKKYGNKGDRIKVKATVTKHDTRDGVKQTIINRPKFS